MKVIILYLIPVTWLASCTSQPEQQADIIITNARIWTANPEQPWAEAIAISGESIIRVGNNEKIQSLTGAYTESIDANGKMVTPGFIDTHVHFVSGGFNLLSIILRDAASPGEFIQRFSDYVGTVPDGTWILGGDWDHQLWGGQLPERTWIDSITTRHPVAVNRLDGHMILANSKAMEMAGIGDNVTDVEGGSIIRDEEGKPTGILKDNAMSLIYSKVPAPSDEQRLEAIRAAASYLVSNGVTSIHDVGDGVWDDLETYRTAESKGVLLNRIYKITPLPQWKRLAEEIRLNGRGSSMLKLGGLKGMVDGSLGSHTAAFFEPYDDTPDDRGFFLAPMDSFYHWSKTADEAGLQVAIHAIGDRAIHELLDTFERISDENSDRDRRFRIEHAQHIAKEDITRFAGLKVIASMQPYHAIDDGRWAESIIGERISTTYAFRSLLDAGATMAFGSDWTVAPATPLGGIYAAVTRRTIDGANPEGWVPEQKITVEEALRAYTINASYAGFDEQFTGSLEEGKLADLVLLDQDITSIDPNTIHQVKVLMTMVGGKIVYDNK